MGQRSLLGPLIAAGGLIGLVAGCSGQSSTIVMRLACPLAQQGSALTMTLPATWTLERTDTAGDPNAHYLWGEYSCAPRRVAWDPAGGDPRPTAFGASQGNSAFRELTVVDGDNPFDYGEGCELAKNSHTDGLASFKNPLGTFYNYVEGARRATCLSIRLPSNFPMGTDEWQNVMQMKQSGPSNGSGGTPVLSLSLQIYGNRFHLFHTASDSAGPTDSCGPPTRAES